MTNFKIVGKGTITLETDGLPEEEVVRLMRILDRVVRQGVLGIRSSYMNLHFDDKGELATVEVLKRWKITDAQKTPV